MLGVKVGYADDLLPTSLAEPTCALEPLCGEIAYLLLDLGVVRAVGSVGKRLAAFLSSPAAR